MKKKKITNEEYNKIVKEWANRLKDLVYLNAEENIRERMSKEYLENLLDAKVSKWDDNLEIVFTVGIVINDLKQMLGRLRREKEEKKHK